MRLVPLLSRSPCGANERLNGTIHALLAVLYGLAVAYHGACALTHWSRHHASHSRKE